MASINFEKLNMVISEIELHDEVNILHLSDLHFGIDKADKSEYEWLPNAEEHADVLKMLLQTLRDPECISENWRPNIVVISGDIAWKGKKEEYEEFNQKFLPQLLEVLGLKLNDTKNRVIVCPGNHDIIREKVNNIHFGQIVRPKKGEPISPEIPEITYGSIVQEQGRWNHFEHFVNECCDGDTNKLCASMTYDEWPWLHFLILNSAWDCRDNSDEGTLRVGVKVAKKVYADISSPDKDNDVIAAIFHHPSIEVPEYSFKSRTEIPHNWLHDSERIAAHDGSQCFSGFIGSKVDVVFNGHVHKKITPKKIDRAWHFINGTVYSNDTFTYHCRILKIHRKRGIQFVELYRALSDLGQKWIVTGPIEPMGHIRNPWDAHFNDLVSDIVASNLQKYRDVLPQIISILIKNGIEINAYNFSAENTDVSIDENEQEKTLTRTLREKG